MKFSTKKNKTFALKKDPFFEEKTKQKKITSKKEKKQLKKERIKKLNKFFTLDLILKPSFNVNEILVTGIVLLLLFISNRDFMSLLFELGSTKQGYIVVPSTLVEELYEFIVYVVIGSFLYSVYCTIMFDSEASSRKRSFFMFMMSSVFFFNIYTLTLFRMKETRSTLAYVAIFNLLYVAFVLILVLKNFLLPKKGGPLLEDSDDIEESFDSLVSSQTFNLMSFMLTVAFSLLILIVSQYILKNQWAISFTLFSFYILIINKYIIKFYYLFLRQ